MSQLNFFSSWSYICLVRLEASANVLLQIPHICGLWTHRWCSFSFWIDDSTNLHSLHLNVRLFSVFFLRTYVLVSNVPFLPELASVWSCLIGKVSVGMLSSFLLSAESFSSCSVSLSLAIALSTLTWSSHSGWGVTSSGMLAPPIGINKAFSSPSSRVSSSVSPRLNKVLAASRSSSMFPTFTGNLFYGTLPG